ncbi:hypothetical protein TA3x_001579 [Tundrisphaera sp. TA3]|uniref:hypothetical protein n=1 Tax=Tundrisphaera sp. TA3 TaxID=3435775 RepID=UPI003EBD76F8
MDRPERCAAVTRRAALGLIPAALLAAAATGCSPAGRAPARKGVARDRLKEMRALRGTGDPRRRAARPTDPARR